MLRWLIIPRDRGVLVRWSAMCHLWPWASDIFQQASSCNPHEKESFVSYETGPCQPPLHCPHFSSQEGYIWAVRAEPPHSHQCEPHHQHCPGLGSTSINQVQPWVVFILILTNQLIRVQNNILRLGKSFWLWKIFKFILGFLAQTTWRLSAKLHKTN